jgi:hypothetical protein
MEMKKFIIRFSVIVTLTWAVNLFVGYLLQMRFRDWSRTGVFFEPLRWKEFDKVPPNTLSTAFLGSSHAYRSFDAAYIDSVLKINSFNFGGSGQSLITTYHVLDYVLEKQPSVKTVVLEVYFKVLYQDEQIRNANFAFKYMDWNDAKWDFWWKGFSWKEKITMVLFPTHQYQDQWKYIPAKILGLPTEGVRGEYQSKGYVRSTRNANYQKLLKKNQFNNFMFDTTAINNEQLVNLYKMADLCRKKGVRFVWVMAPIPPVSYGGIKNPELIHSFIQRKADSLGIAFYDYLDPRKMQLVDSVHFFDDNHMNFRGADLFTQNVVLPLLRDSASFRK